MIASARSRTARIGAAALKGLLALIGALVAGLLQLSALFSNLGPGESDTEHHLFSVVLAVAAGWGTAYLSPRIWPLLGLFATWGAFFIGVMYWIGSSTLDPFVVAVILIGMTSAWAGSLLARSRRRAPSLG